MLCGDKKEQPISLNVSELKKSTVPSSHCRCEFRSRPGTGESSHDPPCLQEPQILAAGEGSLLTPSHLIYIFLEFGRKWLSLLIAIARKAKSKTKTRREKRVFSSVKNIFEGEFYETDKLDRQNIWFTDCFTNSKWQWVNELSTHLTLLRVNQVPFLRMLLTIVSLMFYC